MKYNKQLLGRQSKEFGFIRDTFEKVIRLTDILQFFEGDSLLFDSLALKGGTAINLTMFKLPRLSVDIDLDYCHKISRECMIDDRARINERIMRFMAASDYHLSEKSKHYHSLDSFVYTYMNCGGMKDNIKIEINYSLRSHVLLLERRNIETLGVFPHVAVNSIAALEIYGSKIVALFSRAAARDLYDVNNMVLSGMFGDTEKTMLRKCALFYFAVGGKEIPESFAFDRLETITHFKIRTDLLPVIRKDDAFDLEVARRRVKEYLEDIQVPTESEWEFLDAFRHKKYSPELLFDDAEIVERLRNHPMALWKMQEH